VIFCGDFHGAISAFKFDFFFGGGFRLWVIGFVAVWWVWQWRFEGALFNGFRWMLLTRFSMGSFVTVILAMFVLGLVIFSIVL